MKRLFFLLTTCLITVIASAQTIVPDFSAMDKKAKNTKEQNEILDFKTQFSWCYKAKPDSAINLLIPLSECSKSFFNYKLVAVIYSMLGDLYKEKGEFVSSSKYYYAALKIYERTQDQSSIILLNSALGEIYRASGNFKKSLYYLHWSEEKASHKKFKHLLPQIQSRLAATYFELNYNDYTDPDYLILKDLLKKHFHTEKESQIWQNQTIKYLKCSQEKATITKDTALQILNNNLLGSYYYLKENFDSAIFFHTKALNLIHNYPFSKEEALVLSNLSHGYRKKLKFQEAKKFGIEGLEKANEVDIKVYKWLALNALTEVSKETGNYKNALQFAESRDSVYLVLFNNSSRQKIFELQEKYNLDQKEFEISNLKQEKLQDSQSRNYIIIIFVLIFFILIFALFIVNLRFQNAQQKRKLMEEEKNKQVILLEKSEAINKAQTEFFANISHEIRTPLNSILGFSEILREQNTTPETKEYLTGIITSGKSLLSLINDLMDLSRIEAGKAVLLIEYVNLPMFLEETKNIFNLKANEKNIQLSIHCNLSYNSFYLDEARLRQILFNLIGNSIKYTVEGEITVSVWNTQSDTDTECLIFEVSDSGIGISEAQMENLFKPFHQVSEAHQRIFGGSGLGLMISKRLAELMNGTIEVSSSLGKGTTIRVTINNVKRCETIDFETTRIEPEKIIQHSFSKCKILLVEDNQSNRIVIQSFLKKYNVEIVEALNGKEAIDILQSYIPDIILMDLQMPVMDGYEASKIIKNNIAIKHIPIIAITAAVFKKEEYTDRFNEVIHKPVSKKELIETIEKYVSLGLLSEESKIKSDEENGKKFSEEIISHLQNKLMLQWRQTAVLLSNDDIEEFAIEVQEYSLEKNIPDLTNWSKMIIEYSKAFNIKLLYETFNAFPALVNSMLITKND